MSLFHLPSERSSSSLIRCSLAGRNGGHVRPASFVAYPSLISPLSEGGLGLTPHQAVEIMEDEEINMRLAAEIVEKEKFNEEPYNVQWSIQECFIGEPYLSHILVLLLCPPPPPSHQRPLWHSLSASDLSSSRIFDPLLDAVTRYGKPCGMRRKKSGPKTRWRSISLRE